MSAEIKSAYLVPGSPLPLLRPDAAALRPVVEGLDRARRSLEKAAPDTLIVYSTSWMAVVDQMWLTRSRMQGRFVDHTWHEFGHIDWTLEVDVPVAESAIAATGDFGVRSRGCDYDQFPIDAGTIVLSKALNADAARPLVVTTNNLYHSWETTKRLGAAAVEAAARHGRSVSVVGIGGLSGSLHREGVDFDHDSIASPEDDAANRCLADLVTEADAERVEAYIPEYAAVARADMGMKHLAFVLGALGGKYSGADVLGYGPLCGSGGAVVEFTP
ncbi:tRNA U-34 5-methylaminomethyl-2-thiouridine biosynthesis protein [Streptomyces sp. NPDC026672]|uniref:DODA-type extradiol aromatic ring-opening family dioxygenase n=1 Tax=unclassified Streptomyces TaxID=2593676 RepID=UPI0033E78B8A